MSGLASGKGASLHGRHRKPWADRRWCRDRTPGTSAPGSQFTRRSCVVRRDATRTGRSRQEFVERAGTLMRDFAAIDRVRIKTLIDIDSRRFDKAVADVKERQGTAPRIVFGDFRGVLDDKDIDASGSARPTTRTRSRPSLACPAGMHIYVEKPDAHSRRHSRHF